MEKKIIKWIGNDAPLKTALEEIGMVILSNIHFIMSRRAKEISWTFVWAFLGYAHIRWVPTVLLGHELAAQLSTLVKSVLCSSQPKGRKENDTSLKSEHRVCKESKWLKYLRLPGSMWRGLLNAEDVHDVVLCFPSPPLIWVSSGNTKSWNTSVLEEQL